MNNEDNFAKARLDSIRAKNYNIKTSRNNIKRLFIEEYEKAGYKPTIPVLKVADIFLLLERRNKCRELS